jgi:predicted Zn-dependent protease
LKKVKSTGLAVNLHKALIAGNKRADADRFAAEWVKSNPKDDVFIFYLADTALSHNEYPVAEAHYRTFLALRPDSPIALNNLAWVTAKLHKPGAVGFAERANAMAPNQPALMDTLAMLLAEDNQTAKALALQKKAVGLAPNQPALRLSLAKLLIKAGDKAQAKSELLTLTQLGDKLPERAEVEQLLKTL